MKPRYSEWVQRKHEIIRTYPSKIPSEKQALLQLCEEEIEKEITALMKEAHDEIAP